MPWYSALFTNQYLEADKRAIKKEATQEKLRAILSKKNLNPVQAIKQTVEGYLIKEKQFTEQDITMLREHKTDELSAKAGLLKKEGIIRAIKLYKTISEEKYSDLTPLCQFLKNQIIEMKGSKLRKALVESVHQMVGLYSIPKVVEKHKTIPSDPDMVGYLWRDKQAAVLAYMEGVLSHQQNAPAQDAPRNNA